MKKTAFVWLIGFASVVTFLFVAVVVGIVVMGAQRREAHHWPSVDDGPIQSERAVGPSGYTADYTANYKPSVSAEAAERAERVERIDREVTERYKRKEEERLNALYEYYQDKYGPSPAERREAIRRATAEQKRWDQAQREVETR